MPRTLTSHIDSPKRVGKRLREERERAALSQRELAADLCTAAYVSRVEAGERVPSLQLLNAFAQRLGIGVEYLATGVEAAADGGTQLIDAELALRLGDVTEAHALFEARSQPGDPARSVALAGLGEIAFREGRIDEAIELLEQARAETRATTVEIANVVDSLARAYAASGALEAAIALLDAGFAAAREADAPVETIRFGVLLANALIDNGRFDRAEETLAAVIQDAERTSDPVAAARIYWSQSRLHVLRGDGVLGARYARRAIAILERTEDGSYTAMAYHLLAYAEIEAGEEAAALEHLARGRELFGTRFTRFDEAKFSVEEARAYLGLRQSKRAAQAAARALEVLDTLDPQDRGRAYVVLGDVFAASRDEARARELWETAVKILADDGKPFVMEAARRLADLLEKEGEPEAALRVLKRAMDTSRRFARPK